MTLAATVAVPEAVVHLGDCVAWLDTLDAESVDAIVCDPPYNLGFMGKEWDSFRRARNEADVGRPSIHGRLSRTSPQYSSSLAFQEWMTTWAVACLRVLKPGGHLVAFGGTRTVHRLVCAVEDAGFEIRDQVGWVYYNGFPKSLDVSKALDAAAGAERQVIGSRLGQPGYTEGWVEGAGRGDPETLSPGSKRDYRAHMLEITAPATRAAQRWSGWGTALKPAIEPAVLARKPLGGTVAAGVLAHGTGALNIDGCRFAPGDPAWIGPADPVGLPERDVGASGAGSGVGAGVTGNRAGHRPASSPLGRWPANLYYCPKTARSERERGCGALPSRSGAEAVDRAEGSAGTKNPRAGAGRTAGKVRNHHPTVKPVALMRWLCRLVTPPGGLVVDPFTGSGSTGVAATLEGFRFAGAEMEPEYHAIATARIAHALENPHEWDPKRPKPRRKRAPKPSPVAQLALLEGK